MAKVSLKQLRKSYDGKSDVLAGIDLEIKDGEFTVLVGPSGCGKSTLLRMLCGLESISSGSLEIGGECVNDLPPAKRGIAMVFQSYALYPHMSVYKNMAFGLKIAGNDKMAIDQRIRHAAAILKIEHLLERLPRELSGGQRQRVAIGRAIVREPRLFLFDEPLSNLDASLRVQTRLELAKLHQQLKATIIYVTHDQVEAMTLGDKIVVMHEGHIQQAGTPLELYQQPQNIFVAGFIGSPKMNFLPGVVSAVADDHIRVTLHPDMEICATVDGSGVAVGDQVTVGLRAEHVLDAESGDQRFSARVNLVEHLGEANYLYLSLAHGQEMVIRGDGEKTVQLGEQICFSTSSHAFHVFAADGKALQRLKPGNMIAAKASSLAQAA